MAYILITMLQIVYNISVTVYIGRILMKLGGSVRKTSRHDDNISFYFGVNLFENYSFFFLAETHFLFLQKMF